MSIMSIMKVMSSKDIKNHYGEFVETARRERVTHTHHGRPILVTMSIEEAKALDALKDAAAQVPGLGEARKRNKLIELAGKWRHLERFKSDQEIVDSIRKLRDEGP
jgi:prevent-host-death family protein